MSRETSTERVYARDLPGGGFVAIDVHRVRSLLLGARYIGTLVVERRANWRRAGHLPPPVVEVAAASVPAVLEQLLPIAQYNPAIGAALMRFDSRGLVATPVLGVS